MIIFALMLLVQGGYLFTHRHANFLGLAVSSKTTKHCTFWGSLLSFWGVITLIIAFFPNQVALVAIVLVVGCLADMLMVLLTSALVFKK